MTAPGLPASLRGKARVLAVSHEAVRQAMRAMGLSTSLDSRNDRIRELALAGTPWRAIAAEVGLSTARVRQLCVDLPRRKAGRPWHR